MQHLHCWKHHKVKQRVRRTSSRSDFQYIDILLFLLYDDNCTPNDDDTPCFFLIKQDEDYYYISK
jgi:hypothetical protein